MKKLAPEIDIIICNFQSPGDQIYSLFNLSRRSLVILDLHTRFPKKDLNLGLSYCFSEERRVKICVLRSKRE